MGNCSCAERINERYLLPVLEDILEQYPFQIKGFHAHLWIRKDSTLILKLTLNIIFFKIMAKDLMLEGR